MSRARATALVLVNWKGVFYERYGLDRHVTVLEGDNGAGKTTVMIGAYVVLLPDMTRLRFTNLGETGATGGDKGIWGRLGEFGRPSYAVLDFDLGGRDRIIAGVHLERKGEPTVAPTPFIVKGLPRDRSLQEVFLLTQGDQEHVPELPELRENVASLGAHLKVFGTAREYFAALFEYGITPMRMGTDEERNKLNEMLKTSMTGGMSRGLLSELRSFLLKKEGGLANTLVRMRSNLDACRRTRTEVRAARRMEREIGAVYEAGERMFGAAVAATHERAAEMANRIEEAESQREKATEDLSRAEAERERVNQELDSVKNYKSETSGRLEEAKKWKEDVEQAVDWNTKLEERRAERCKAHSAWEGASQIRDVTQSAWEKTDTELKQADEAREAAAGGVGDLQKGLSELHRRADGYKRVTARLEEARTKLELPELKSEDAELEASAGRKTLKEQDKLRQELQRRLADDEEHRREHAVALMALELILNRPVEVEHAEQKARRAGVAVRDWQARVQRKDEILKDLALAKKNWKRQVDAERRAVALQLDFEHGQGRQKVVDEVGRIEEEFRRAAEKELQAVGAIKDAMREREEADLAISSLQERARNYGRLTGLALEVGEGIGHAVTDRGTLDQARTKLRGQLSAQENEKQLLCERRQELMDDARGLRTSGGQFSPGLLQLRDDLAADLVASRFDDVGVDEAAEIEALLGPLANGLIVDDIDEAARRIQGRSEDLPTVWLVSDEASFSLDPEQKLGREGRRDVVIKDGANVRVTRIPTLPTLGLLAREQRAEELEEEAEQLGLQLEQLATPLRATNDLSSLADDLLEGLEVWRAGDPNDELEEMQGKADEADSAQQAALRLVKLEEQRRQELGTTLKALRELLPDSHLLDPPAYEQRVLELQDELEGVKAAARELARVEDAPTMLEDHQHALRNAPLDDKQLDAARVKVAELAKQRGRLVEAIEALDYVAANRGALAWSDAGAKLASKKDLLPALKAQLDLAIEAKKAAKEVEENARRKREESEKHLNTAHASLESAKAAVELALRMLEDTGVQNPSEKLLAEAKEAVLTVQRQFDEYDGKLGGLRELIGKKSSERDVANDLCKEAVTTVEKERKRARPALEAWETLQPQAEDAGVLDPKNLGRFQQTFSGSGFVNAFSSAREERRVLLERLGNAEGGDEILESVRGLDGNSEQTIGVACLRVWLVVRDWLRRRLPAQIAEEDEPLVALRRLGEHLAGLETRLDRQEGDLRGASEDVARGIDVQIRRTRGQVRRLNKHLEGVRFGSVAGIRVKLQRIEKMEQVLRALREGAAQELLFQASIPVEEALDEIFRRYGGVRSGGHKLLDYREYIRLQVQIKRLDCSTWEEATPTGLSTGEAIGVGAALMMVVVLLFSRALPRISRQRRPLGRRRRPCAPPRLSPRSPHRRACTLLH